jgi:hypothetical protein
MGRKKKKKSFRPFDPPLDRDFAMCRDERAMAVGHLEIFFPQFGPFR